MRRMITTYGPLIELNDPNLFTFVDTNKVKLNIQPGKAYKFDITELRALVARWKSFTDIIVNFPGTIIMDDSWDGEHLSDQSWCDAAYVGLTTPADEPNYIDIKVISIPNGNPFVIRVDAVGNVIIGKALEI